MAYTSWAPHGRCPRLACGQVKKTAGLLLYRNAPAGREVLLVHPSGNYNRKAPWSIPKGEPSEGEELEAAARRETREETGIDIDSDVVSIGFIDYKKSRKRIFCFFAEAPPGISPSCASWEVDRAEFLPIDDARMLIHQDQAVFIDRLLDAID